MSILETNPKTIGELAVESITTVSHFLDLSTQFEVSSQKYQNQGLERQARLIDICKQEKATHYINALGGQELYQKAEFEKEGIKLSFIKSLPVEYKQFKNEFIPWLSIIDLLMFCPKDEIGEFVKKFDLV